MALGTDLSGRSPPARIPKLKYRNPLSADQLAQLPVHSPAFQQQDEAASPPPTASSINSRPSLDTFSVTSSSLASTHSSAGSSNDSKSSKRKTKAKSVFGFLSLKEPSQLALERFAEAQRQQSKENASSPIPGSKPASIYPAQKLPSHVPKVNSKWDGIPEVAKKHQSITITTTSSASNNGRWSTSSRGSQGSQGSQFTAIPSRLSNSFSVMSDATRNPPNSIASPRPSTSSVKVYNDHASEGPANADLPDMSWYFPKPHEPVASGALPVEALQMMTYQPADFASPPHSPAADFVFDSPPPGHYLPHHRPVSPASSTDSADTIVRDTADVIFKKLNNLPHQGLWADASAVQAPAEAQNDVVPKSHDFLFGDDSHPGSFPHAAEEEGLMQQIQVQPDTAAPSVAHYAPARPVQNFSRPMVASQPSPPRSLSTSYRATPMSSALPTLYEASLASTNDHNDDDDDAQSIAPSTVAPSVLSQHWYESPRERLGLGGRLRMGDAQPWDSQRPPPGKRKSRLSMFGKATART